jgi:iron-sulfur cluster assembly accessory protein
MVKLTPKAAQRVQALLEREGKTGGLLRLKVVSGGCSGMSYEFELAGQPKSGDLLSETDGVRVAVDAKADKFVDGAVIDYIQTLMKQGFEVKNPKASSSCSCGTSFSVESFSV